MIRFDSPVLSCFYNVSQPNDSCENITITTERPCSLCFLPAVSGGGPSSVSISEETAVSLLVSWVPPNAHVLQYRVSYTALTGADTQDSSVSDL